jgi:hypothetical protein
MKRIPHTGRPLTTITTGDALWVFAMTGDRRYYDYAVNQMAWILGRNPFGESWLATQAATEYTRVQARTL